jgi:hypothetical protein
MMEGPLESRLWSGMDRRIRLMERDGFMGSPLGRQELRMIQRNVAARNEPALPRIVPHFRP